MTTRVIIKNDSTSTHKVVVQAIAGKVHFDRVELAPGESHSQNVWAQFVLEVSEQPLTTSKDDVT